MAVVAGIEGLEKTRKDGASVSPEGERVQDLIAGVEIAEVGYALRVP